MWSSTFDAFDDTLDDTLDEALDDAIDDVLDDELDDALDDAPSLLLVRFPRMSRNILLRQSPVIFHRRYPIIVRL